MTALGIKPGDRVEITSSHGAVVAVAGMDSGLRRRTISITHGYGCNPDETEIPERTGCNVGRLLSANAEYDPVSGIPRMGAVPVRIRPVALSRPE
jgi:anaerobic selenocysteine-containing dehydrogenase